MPGGGGVGPPTSPMAPLEESPLRAPLPQFSDKLIDADPARRMPQRPAQSAADHPLEAFRDFRREGSSSSAGEGASSAANPEVFGLAKKPKNLAEIYRAPVELCFMGTFDELCEAGRSGQRWLLVNIQSPTEFASQQLNADTWQDESLREVIKSGFLFWQQYFDSQHGATYVRYYLQNEPTFPHIGVIDPITGQLVKSWTGFKDAERLLDKLMDYADAPPRDVMAVDGDMQQAHMALGQDEEQAQLADAIASSLAGVDTPWTRLAPTAPPPPEWGPAPELPPQGSPGSIQLRVRLPSGQNWLENFSLEHSLGDVLRAVHHLSGHSLSTTKKYQLATHGAAPLTQHSEKLRALQVSGRAAVSLIERD
uniref:UAS domain-containing protein n=1 Tax=Coccolithus braarudii TaxID=221442 RepID=A0A7S0LD78_9EUKA